MTQGAALGFAWTALLPAGRRAVSHQWCLPQERHRGRGSAWDSEHATRGTVPALSPPWKLRVSSQRQRGGAGRRGKGTPRVDRAHCWLTDSRGAGRGSGPCPRAMGRAYVLRGQRRRRVLGDSCPTAACRCTWWIYRSGGQSRREAGQAWAERDSSRGAFHRAGLA